MLECTISHKVNWYFGSDYMSIAKKLLENLFKLYSEKEKKLGIVHYLNYSNFVAFSSWNQGQIGIKMETKHVVY